MALPRAWMRVAVAALLLLLAAPAQAAVDHLWVTDQIDTCASNPDTGAVYMVNTGTHAILPFSSGGLLASPVGIAASPDGKTVWVADMNAFDPTPPSDGGCFDGGGGVIAIDTATGQQTAVSGNGSDTWNDPRGIAYDPAHGTLIVSDYAPGPSQQMVYSVNPSTGARTPIVQSGFLVQPEGVAVAPDGTVYVADPGGTGTIWKINQVGGSPDPPIAIATGPDLGDPHDLAFKPNGNLVVVDGATTLQNSTPHPGFVTVDLTTLPPPTASNAAHEFGPSPSVGPSFCGSGGSSLPPFTTPKGIATASSGTNFYVVDRAADPMWCPGLSPKNVLFHLDADAIGTWVAGLDPTTPWIHANGVTLAKNRLPVPAIGIPTSGGTAGQAVEIDGSHSFDPDGDPLTIRFDLDNDGTFETPADANGRVSALFTATGDYPIGIQVDDGTGGVASTVTSLHVVATPSSLVDQPVGTSPVETPQTPPGTTTNPVLVETTTPKTPGTLTFQQLLSPNGVIVPLSCSADCTVDAILQILLKDYKNLTAANKVITIGTGRIVLTAGKNGKLRIKLTKEARKKLKIALAAAHISVKRKIKLNLVLQSKYKSGKKKTIRRKIILKG